MCLHASVFSIKSWLLIKVLSQRIGSRQSFPVLVCSRVRKHLLLKQLENQRAWFVIFSLTLPCFRGHLQRQNLSQPPPFPLPGNLGITADATSISRFISQSSQVESSQYSPISQITICLKGLYNLHSIQHPLSLDHWTLAQWMSACCVSNIWVHMCEQGVGVKLESLKLAH